MNPYLARAITAIILVGPWTIAESIGVSGWWGAGVTGTILLAMYIYLIKTDGKLPTKPLDW
ncbi:MAG: hypothetical protein ACFHVJ_07795 [Aestuariibacter sp.]